MNRGFVAFVYSKCVSLTISLAVCNAASVAAPFFLANLYAARAVICLLKTSAWLKVYPKAYVIFSVVLNALLFITAARPPCKISDGRSARPARESVWVRFKVPSS